MASQPSNKNLEWDHDPELLAVIIGFTILSMAATVLRVFHDEWKRPSLAVLAMV